MAKIDVTLGAQNVASSNEPNRITLTSYNFVKHPSYSITNNLIQNNIGLIQLPDRVSFNS